MANCPIKSSKDWGDLATRYGEEGAYEIFIKNGYKVPAAQSWDSNHFVDSVNSKYKTNTPVAESTALEIKREIEDAHTGNFYVALPTEDNGKMSVSVSGRPLVKEDYNNFIANEKTETTTIADPQERYINYKDYLNSKENGSRAILPNQDVIILGDSFSNTDHTEITLQQQYNEQQFNRLTDKLMNNMPQVNEVILDRSLEGTGQLEPDGVIRVNPEQMIESTIGHEFAHLLIDLRGGLSDPFIAQALEQLEGTEMATNIREKLEDRPNLTEEKIQKEILAEAIGLEVVNIFKAEENNTKLMNWITRLFRWLGARVGITKNNARELARELLYDPNDTYQGKQAKYVQRQEAQSDLTDEQKKALEEARKRKQAIIDKPKQRAASKLNKIREKSLKTTQSLLEYAANRGKTDDQSRYNEIIKNLENEDTGDLRAVLEFFNEISKEVNGMYKSYQNQKELHEKWGKEMTLKQLSAWYNSLLSFDVLEDMQGLLDNYSTSNKKEHRELKNSLANVMKNRNTLMQEYVGRGAEILVESIEPYSSHTIGQVRDQKMSEWRKANIDKKMSRKERLESQKEYADKYIEENYSDIIQNNKELLLSEMERASQDTSFMRRWLDTMLNSNDVVLSSVVRKIVIKDGLASERARVKRNEMLKIVDELYKNSGHTWYGGDLAELYDEILEKDSDGNRTGHFLTEVSSSLDVEYRKFLESVAELNDKDRQAAITKWNNENKPMRKKDYYKAKNAYIESLTDTDLVSEKEWATHKKLMKKHKNYVTTTNHLNEDAKAAINLWHVNNVDNYIDISSKWLNKDFQAFKNKMENSPSDPMVRLYKLIMDAKKEISSETSRASMSNTVLPFIIKGVKERKGAGQSFKAIGSEWWDNATKRRLDDTEHGQFTDMNDKPLSFVPWNYDRPRGETREFKVVYSLPLSEEKQAVADRRNKTEKLPTKKVTIIAKDSQEAEQIFKRNAPLGSEINTMKEGKSLEWNDADQSYDIAGIMDSYFRMAYKHIEMDNILPEVEFAKHVAVSRDYVYRDFRDNPVLKKLGMDGSRPREIKGEDSNVAAMFSDFVDMMVYGQHKREQGSINIFGMEFDKSKAADALARYSSVNMLGINLMQGVTNITVGEMHQLTEGFAGEFFTVKGLHEATKSYTANVYGMANDVGSLVKENKVTHLVEKWDILNEYHDGKYVEGSSFGRNMSTSALFFLSSAGEHFMQSRVMLAMLMDVKAYDKDGNHIGSMYDQYSVNEGQLVLSDEVSLEKSKWNKEEQELFGAKVREVLSRIHGRYSAQGKSAAQLTAQGRLAFMFRKFVVPGYQKRFESNRYHNILESYTEGSYVTTGKFLYKLATEAKALGMDVVAINWKEMSPRDKSNVIRTLGELATFATFLALGAIFLSMKGDADPDDKDYYAGLAVWALRVKAEMGFFANPLDTLKIMQTPAVAMSTIENFIRFMNHLIFGWEEYERGSWKGKFKITKDAINMLPVVNQIYKMKNIEDKLIYLQ